MISKGLSGSSNILWIQWLYFVTAKKVAILAEVERRMDRKGPSRSGDTHLWAAPLKVAGSEGRLVREQGNQAMMKLWADTHLAETGDGSQTPGFECPPIT